ncbi:sigma-70-like protein [Murinocardiopsis flavida]|uniref:Sigma-70-like protein n=1 Tax=Murinocardiopsis flavida TaxID=645275 RepID=A0A2P8DET2_9ACTN|nr:sigma-70 region 4 domain-containing protein [Murinocardiopsis flavida]PSK95720.1 sigma-70-like protein [Murinocardiopsis flavida]
MPATDRAHDAHHEPLRHGFSRADIDDIARLAASTIRWPGGLDWGTRAEVAWSAIAEHLYSCSAPPSRGELVTAGWSAITDHVQRYNSFRGRAWGYESRTLAGFERFWALSANPVPGPEARIVDRTALAQIWAVLPEQHRRVLLALADHESYADAAESLGVTKGSYYALISRARKAFFALWHEGETPSRPWGNDVRGKKPRTKNVTVIAVRQRERLRARRGTVPVVGRVARDIGVSGPELADRYRAGETFTAIGKSVGLSLNAVRERIRPHL